VGAVLREQNALPLFCFITNYFTAKSAIDNCRAGRAAKGENPSFCAKKRVKAVHRIIEGSCEERRKRLTQPFLQVLRATTLRACSLPLLLRQTKNGAFYRSVFSVFNYSIYFTF